MGTMSNFRRRGQDLQHLASPLRLSQTLQEQGISGCDPFTQVCSNGYHTAWRYVSSFPVFEGKCSLQGLTQIRGTTNGEYLYHLPQSLKSFTFGDAFNESLEGVTLPSSLQSLL